MTRLLPARVAVATGCVWLAAGPAHAFFPPLPLPNTPVTVLPPPVLPVAPDGNLTPVPPVAPPPVTPPPNVPQEVIDPPRPNTVPEPASLVSAAIGVAAVVGAVRRRKRVSPA
jgi:hypothetical protein